MQMEHIDFAFLVGGEAGAGVMLTGRIISKIAMRSGYEVFATNEYPSLIRGGHNWFLGRVGTEKVYSQKKEVEILVALDELTLKKHEHRLSSNGIIISEVKKAENALTVPMTEIARNLGAPPVARNMVAVGAVTGLLGIDIKVVEEVIADTFQPRGKQTVEINKKLAKEGYSYGEAAKGSLGFILKKRQSGKKLFLTGNDATALGALAAGMRIYFAYPMTPASPILHYLAAVEDEAGIVVVQPESEIAAINMAT
ncbi:MAG TPA: pyruvate ferredoxin oxidoreductase, partial [Thermofilum sp.]|nr:pyruvate ferredoxin oxidoreductase [Thermofilum sp.]